MSKQNENLIWSVMESLDKIRENTHTDDEWHNYHLLYASIESIYNIKISTIKYGLSGEVIRHVPIFREIEFNEIFDYLKES